LGESATGRGAATNKAGVAVAIVGLVGLMAFVALRANAPTSTPPPKADVSEAPDLDSDPDSELPNLEHWRAALLQDVPFSPEKDFALGPGDAPVTLIEFSDFQCPFCRTATGALKEVLSRYPDDVRWVFKNFPLDMTCNADMSQQLHPIACRAAVVARCAGAEDPRLFWEMHDAIFQSELSSEEELLDIAAALGLTSAGFRHCIDTEATLDAVQSDVDAGRKLGVSATPTIFVNGRVAPSYSPDDLGEIIEHIVSSN